MSPGFGLFGFVKRENNRLQCPGTAGVSPRSPTEGVLLITNGVGYQTSVFKP